jgi:hypothetical protein
VAARASKLDTLAEQISQRRPSFPKLAKTSKVSGPSSSIEAYRKSHLPSPKEPVRASAHSTSFSVENSVQTKIKTEQYLQGTCTFADFHSKIEELAAKEVGSWISLRADEGKDTTEAQKTAMTASLIFSLEQHAKEITIEWFQQNETKGLWKGNERDEFILSVATGQCKINVSCYNLGVTAPNISTGGGFILEMPENENNKIDKS